MKKLVMLAMLAVTAISVNAASVDWKVTCGNMKDHTGAAFSGQYALYAVGGGLASDTLVLTINSCSATLNQYAFTVDSGMEAGESYSFYYVITDSAGYKFTSDTKGTFVALEVGATNIAFGNQATATGDASKWKGGPGPEPIPEPTSGLLLVLGMAGLALRRRRA